jgi:tetratricopeptide (TPR) repeat protein
VLLALVGCRDALQSGPGAVKESSRNAQQPVPSNFKEFARGVEAVNNGDNDLAIKYLGAAIQTSPHDAQAYLHRGVAYFRKKDYDKAIQDFTEAIRLDPNNPTCYVRRGLAHDGKMESDEAVQDYTEAIRLEPNSPKTLILRAVAHTKLRQNSEAVKDCDQAIRLEPKNASAYVTRGIAHADEREYEKAVDDYTEALHLKPNFFLAYNKLAWLRATCPRDKHRNGRDALDNARKACELSDWDDPHNLEALAAACGETGNFAEAVKWQQKALENQHYGREEADEARMRLKLYQAKKPYRELDRP